MTFTLMPRGPPSSDCLHDAGRAVRIRDRVRADDGLAARGADLVDDGEGRVDFGGVRNTVRVADSDPEVVDDDAGTARREQERVGATEVAAGACHDGDPVVEAKLAHALSPTGSVPLNASSSGLLT
jgi:hypothetical protein